ncbi:LSm family protein [Filimonas effusa]|uniref:Ribosome maturation factor RimP n=1 Tax=Filimonas effusa TaxID=2508721 RepID=A0A4Q1D5D8_9BACT|nr:ribosome maturation factor [Filimonas effusa]RXK83588.1 ribosome maturation factor [Filimonas effusa]
MSNELPIQKIEELVDQLLADQPEFFKVQVKIKPTNNIKVYIDGDNGLPIDRCVKFNRKLYAMLEEAALYPEGEFSLEVSSPGISEPLKLHRQYVKNIGRLVEVVFLDGETKEGKLLQVTEEDLLLEHTSGKGKKAVTQQLVIPFNNIKTTTVQIQF